MKMVTRCVLIAMLLLLAAPAFAGMPTQMWQCQMEDDATEEEVIEEAQDWLKKARAIKGGERLKARVLFPVAVNSIGDADVWFVISAPSFEEWGRFWDNYIDSDVGDSEDHEERKVNCPDAALWDSTPIE